MHNTKASGKIKSLNKFFSTFNKQHLYKTFAVLEQKIRYLTPPNTTTLFSYP